MRSILSQIDNVKPEPKLGNEPQQIVSTSPPAIGNTNVRRSMVNDNRLPFWEDLILDDIDGEKWIDIKGYDSYMCSNYGRIKSKQRYCSCKGGSERLVRERIMKQQKRRLNYGGGYRAEVLLQTGNYKKGGHPVISLVASSFNIEKNDDEVYFHKDGNSLNNSLDNIIIGNKSNVQQNDIKRNGRTFFTEWIKLKHPELINEYKNCKINKK